MFNIFQATGDEVIHANDFISFIDKLIAKM